MTNHVRDDQAFQSALNAALANVLGVNVGTVAITQKTQWIADAGKVTGSEFAVAFTPSADLKKAIALLKPGAVTPPPVDPPKDPPPVDPPSGDAPNIGAIQPGDTWNPPEDA